MKIAFIGTHGTGKTTLAHELISKLKKKGIDIDFLGEIVRKCPFPINENTTKKSQIWIILNQIIKEMETEERCKVLVSDRSVLDGYCYYVNQFGEAKFLEALIKKHLKTYSYIIRVPIRKGWLKKDKIRSISEKFQKDIDKQFDKLLNKFKVKHINLKNLNDETGNKIVEKILNNLH
ncbi:MAG: AAA family ATPase [Nanoarchaeota archaeon]|nr:AAA family ATPase [Nanoarchaeota archaeon]